ncbi:MAG TPA: aminotransferase class I/II-fold pyridoxal phosphate-dependent enzyme, partial [Candidatus Alectryocaccobium stercorigallinarum]|nr:aminotransferase class I/II-fold pyridoxal phosphate-dependent enzyme [Candidatus Alectryocaccobium stercorigallinarum]
MCSWKNNIRRVVPYTPGAQPKLDNIIKLNTNENPYPPSSEVEAVINGFDSAVLRKYPDPMCSVLVEAIAKTYGVKPKQVFVGVGSDDVLAMSFMTFFCSDKPVLFPDVTYSFYDVWADMLHIPYEKIALDEKFRIRAEDYAGKVNGGIIFPNPNAPTGLEMAQSEIESIVKSNPESVVIVDEAYVDFGAKSALPLTNKYDNLLVV